MIRCCFEVFYPSLAINLFFGHSTVQSDTFTVLGNASISASAWQPSFNVVDFCSSRQFCSLSQRLYSFFIPILSCLAIGFTLQRKFGSHETKSAYVPAESSHRFSPFSCAPFHERSEVCSSDTVDIWSNNGMYGTSRLPICCRNLRYRRSTDPGGSGWLAQVVVFLWHWIRLHSQSPNLLIWKNRRFSGVIYFIVVKIRKMANPYLDPQSANRPIFVQ